ncbi:MAG: prepilin-type N-terminal cleavage/methylation domain-containing protein [Tissierellia bacterium]|mgnify:CR=1 FL=1|nr:prepilin-type N-terminal cleavage/methylation domain-containing protein [Tissierellia bacterium]
MEKIKFNNRGMTLIELLIVLGIIGILVQLIYSIFFVGNKSFTMGRDKGFAQQDARIAAEFINKELRTANELELEASELEDRSHYYSIGYERGKLIKKVYNDGLEDIDRRTVIHIESLESIEFYRGDDIGLIKVIIRTMEKSEAFKLDLTILLENKPDMSGDLPHHSEELGYEQKIYEIYYIKYD